MNLTEDLKTILILTMSLILDKREGGIDLLFEELPSLLLTEGSYRGEGSW